MKKISAFILFLFICAVLCASPSGSFASLDSFDLGGNRVTASVFAENKITMINCFTTWCRYCIREMPDLVKLGRNLPDGAGLVGFCADAYDSPEALDAIVAKYKIDFPVIRTDTQTIIDSYNLTGYPTTLFVDSSGKIVGEITGAPRKPYDTYLAEIKRLLLKNE